ncbi:unnamed protein product [Pleuronectes platessa]|uniref:Uncharacterized protein n=1 Tax=Pleuronectes platessa TaxID=8262 RepID=A0A9N7Z9V6_PLEPL|nr:unnamed protein product [Pleuronectes platessa]
MDAEHVLPGVHKPQRPVTAVGQGGVDSAVSVAQKLHLIGAWLMSRGPGEITMLAEADAEKGNDGDITPTAFVSTGLFPAQIPWRLLRESVEHVRCRRKTRRKNKWSGRT